MSASVLDALKAHSRLGRSVSMQSRVFAPRISNSTISRVCMKTHTCLTEVAVKGDEDPSLAINRFSREVRYMNVVNEVRRRKNFENKQDRMKRKRREKGYKKRQEKYPHPSYAETQITGLLSVPFQELFEEKLSDQADSLFGTDGYFAASPSSTQSRPTAPRGRR